MTCVSEASLAAISAPSRARWRTKAVSKLKMLHKTRGPRGCTKKIALHPARNMECSPYLWGFAWNRLGLGQPYLPPNALVQGNLDAPIGLKFDLSIWTSVSARPVSLEHMTSDASCFRPSGLGCEVDDVGTARYISASPHNGR
jgi:hypothetical protein